MSFRPSLMLLLLGVSTAALLPSGRAEAKYTAELNADTLVLTGNGQGDTLAVRLTPGDPTHVDVDVSNDGTADFSFDRSLFSAISISAGSGPDTILIDESFGAFTDEKIVIDGGGGNDTITGGSGDDTIIGGNGNDVIDPGEARRGPGRRRQRHRDLEPGRRQRRSRARTATTSSCSTAPTSTSSSTSRQRPARA
jgi:hypothetical protein